MTNASALTPRELEVAALVAEGLTNKEIAARLFLSERTAEGHVEHIRDKLGFSTRSQIATWHTQSRATPATQIVGAPISSASRVGSGAKARLSLRTVLGLGAALVVAVAAVAVVAASWPRSPSPSLVTVAGLGTSGFSGDGGPATVAQLARPIGLVFDRVGDLYVADHITLEVAGGGRGESFTRIRRIDGAGTIRTIAGDGGVEAYNGEFARAIHLERETYLAVDATGNLYLGGAGTLAGSDAFVARLGNGKFTIIAGGRGSAGYSGDGGRAIGAGLSLVKGLALNSLGEVFVADSGNDRIRVITLDGAIATIAGNGTRGFSGDGGPATAAAVFAPVGVAVSPDGSVYIADTNNHRVRKVDHSGNIVTVAGSGVAGFAGDGRAAREAQLNMPLGLTFDRAGNLYIADSANNRVRMVDINGVITTVAGDGRSEQLREPTAVTIDPNGVLFVADTGNHRIRKLETR